jgi:polyisoprenyl-phosphate glycosyltransferase
MTNRKKSTNTEKTPPTLAIVVPCFNEEESMKHSNKILLKTLNEMIEKKEVSLKSYILFVDDGSHDETWLLITKNHKKDRRVKGISLSRNYGHQHALMAGLQQIKNKCDISISIDADLQQDPKAMNKFIVEYNNGADIVFGIREKTKSTSFLKRSTSALFYKLLTFMKAEIIPDHADYRLLSNRAVSALTLHKEPNLFLRGLCLKLGFKTAVVKHIVFDRKYGSTKYSVKKMFSLALNGFATLTVFPLRAIALVGLLCFTSSLIMGLYALWHTIIIGNTVPGWASTILPIYFIGGIQLLALGVFGEYLGKIYTTVQNRPRWIISNQIGIDTEIQQS